MQNGCATFLVIACSQKTCSGHCTTADLRMRFMAYGLPVDSSVRGQGAKHALRIRPKLAAGEEASCAAGD